MSPRWPRGFATRTVLPNPTATVEKKLALEAAANRMHFKETRDFVRVPDFE
jgi:hypothetical protein